MVCVWVCWRWIIGTFFRVTTSPPGIILCMHPANERWRYNVTSLIGWAHIQHDPCATGAIIWLPQCQWHNPQMGKWITQVQFIDAWHQIWKLCEMYFWMKRSIYVWVYLFAIYALCSCTKGALSLLNCLDHDQGTLDSKTWCVHCTVWWKVIHMYESV